MCRSYTRYANTVFIFTKLQFRLWIIAVTPVIDLCCFIVAWLSLQSGISRDTANILLHLFKFIILTTLRLIKLALAAADIEISELTELKMLLDIQTVYSQCQLDPTIEWVICCPKCFKQYPNHDGGPSQCNWYHFPKSRPCNTNLYTQHETSGGLQRIPECLYTTQSFESWLTFLLSHSQIEDHLYQTFAKSQGVFNPGWMHDIHDSPAWSSLHPFLQSPYHLVFALYIDWFNPLTNKIAGMSVNFWV